MCVKRTKKGDEIIINEILTVKDVAKRMGVKVPKVHEYRHAGLIRMFRTGTGYQCTEQEFNRFLDLLTEQEMDLSTSEKIVLAGQANKKDPAATGTSQRKDTIQ